MKRGAAAPSLRGNEPRNRGARSAKAYRMPKTH
jgi:hypothetical protein